jgi:hypothetical protein
VFEARVINLCDRDIATGDKKQRKKGRKETETEEKRKERKTGKNGE